MLGDLISELQEKVTAYCVLSAKGLNIEVDLRAAGELAGVEVTAMGTHGSAPGPGGL